MDYEVTGSDYINASFVDVSVEYVLMYCIVTSLGLALYGNVLTRATADLMST